MGFVCMSMLYFLNKTYFRSKASVLKHSTYSTNTQCGKNFTCVCRAESNHVMVYSLLLYIYIFKFYMLDQECELEVK